MLLTKWGKNLDCEHPLQEYPRPQFVRDSYINLNGKWNFTIRKNSTCPVDFPEEIIVPFSPETPLSGISRVAEPDDYLFYQREFVLPKGFNKGKVYINFGAVDQETRVYINNKFVGAHVGGYTPFSFDITDRLAPEGEVNSVMVRVRDYTDTRSHSRGKQKINRGGIWYSPQSGIWQTVWLESTPVKHLRSVKITPDYDNGTVEFEYNGTTNVEVLIYDNGRLIADTTEHIVEIPDFKSWSPESPFLYDVEFKACGETIKSYFGMRKFSVEFDKNGLKRLCLNNKPYFHNGLLDQGYYPDGYLTPPSYDAMESDIFFTKAAGFNMLRKHIKIEPLLWYHYCDVHGILVWQDMVNGGGEYGPEVSVIPFVGIKLDDRNYRNFHRSDFKGREMYYTELKKTMNLLYNCPCVAMWVPFNEGWGQFDSAKIYELIKEKDPTRTVDTTSGWHDMGASDVDSKHIYFTPIRVKYRFKPYVLSEFGGFSLRIKNHTFNDKMFGYKIFKTKESLTRAYARLYNKTIIPQINNGLSAAVYTQLTDVEDELNGLMTYDRAVTKIDIDELRKINAKVKFKKSVLN